MKKLILAAMLLLQFGPLFAQSAEEEIRADKLLAASNLTAYYTLPGAGEITPAPAGYKPFYVSTYMRHGSRYLCDVNEYLNPLKTLQEADDAGVLSPKGKQLLKELGDFVASTNGRIEELTRKGALQHRGIAKRLYERFPEAFSGNARVNGRSSVVIRCILSMANEVTTLRSANPKIDFDIDASRHDMYYTANTENSLDKYASTGKAAQSYADYEKRILKEIVPSRFVSSVISDGSYIKWKVDSWKFFSQVMNVALNMQSHDNVPDLLSEYFTQKEVYNFWRLQNYWWYLHFGPSPLSGGIEPFREANLLNNIVTTADSIVKLKENGATMRFGHEVCLLPLACLMELGKCGYRTENPDSVEANWRNYKYFPMAGNIQLIFYRSKKNRDILVKALLNEVEMTMPVKPVTKGFYRWSDLSSYYRAKLEAYRHHS